jgi:hypothetical protein
MIDGTEEITTATKYPTWAWVCAVLVGVVMLLIGAGLSSVNYTVNTHAAQIQSLDDKKVDKEMYRADMADIKSSLKTLIEMHMKPNGERRR